MSFWQKVNQWWLWLTIFALPISTRKVIWPVFHGGEFVDYASVSLFLSDVLIVGLLVVWLLDLSRSKKFNWGPKVITVPLLVLAGWMWLSLLWCSGPSASWVIGMIAALRFTLYAGFYFYLINRVTDIKTILYPLACGMVLQSFIALGQYFANHSLGLKWLGESVLDPAKSGIPVVLVEGVRRLRAHGTLPHANVLGGYLAVGLALIWPLLFSRIPRRWQTVWWLVAGLSLVGLFFSLSRSAWLAFGGGMVLVSIWLMVKHFHRWRDGLKVGWWVVLAVAILVASQYRVILPRWNSSNVLEQISISSRVQQWADFQRIYPAHPLTGVGIGQYFLNVWQPEAAVAGWHYQPALGGWSYEPGRKLSYYQPIHDIYLLAVAELGPVGGIALLWLLGGVIWVAIRLWRRQPVWGVTVLWAILAVAGIGVVDHYFWTLPSGRLMFMLVVSSAAILWINPGYNKKDGRTAD